MTKIITVLSLLLLTACASEPAKTASEPALAPAPTPAAVAAEKTEEESSSRVLNKSKKCPKNTKLVKGKCLLQVETTE